MDEIWDLIESVSEGFPTCYFTQRRLLPVARFSLGVCYFMTNQTVLLYISCYVTDHLIGCNERCLYPVKLLSGKFDLTIGRRPRVRENKVDFKFKFIQYSGYTTYNYMSFNH